jgi:signal transduction histidine kinase
LTIAVIRALEVFDVETARLIERMEQQQILATERSRLARDLHDGAIQKVYTAGLLVESAHKLGNKDNPLLSARLEKAEAVLDDAIKDLRRNLGELHTSSPGPFSQELDQLARDPRFRSLVEISLQNDLGGEEALSPARGEHVLSVITEALANIVRHARAKNVSIHVCRQDGLLKLRIEDDGIGMPAEKTSGYGLRNMRDRARLLGGQVSFSSGAGKGTIVTMEIPWEEER